jgi:hypothetical protein
MTLAARKEPAEARRIVSEALARRIRRAPSLPSLFGSPRIGTPLPVYHLSRKEAALGDPVSTAKMIGWRYAVVGGAWPGVAALKEDAGALFYAGLSHGTPAQRLLDAALLAEDNLGSAAEEYEPRVVEIPSLRLSALWLSGRGGQNYYVVIEDGRAAETSVLQLERSIQPRIAAALEGLRGRRPAAHATLGKASRPNRKLKVVRVANALLAVAIVALAFGAVWIPGLNQLAVYPWSIDLVLTIALFCAIGMGNKGLWFGILVDGRNRISLSRLQLVIWTILFVNTFLIVYIWNIAHATLDASTAASVLGKALDFRVPPTVWLLMGISGVSAAATPAILSAKPLPAANESPPPVPSDPSKYLDGLVVKRRAGQRPQWSDILLGDDAGNADSIDVSKLQQLLLSFVAIAAYGFAIARTLVSSGGIGFLPDMSTGFLALIGASHATYLVYKGVSHSN